MMARPARQHALVLIRQALREDRARRDLTSRSLLAPSRRIRTRVIAKQPGVLAGGPVAVWTFQALDRRLRCRLHQREGAPLVPGTAILTVEGSARAILGAERVALNLLGHLSGVATLTAAFVRRVRPFRAQILDTRKTLPDLRALQKYAVRIGGGYSHRASLEEAILIKTNHLKTLGRGTGGRGQGKDPIVQQAIMRARRKHPRKFLEVEVTTSAELRAALAARPDAILLDNCGMAAIRRAVQLRKRLRGRWPLLEVSGGVTLANVRALAAAGVDCISIGRLTHSAPALDLALRVDG